MSILERRALEESPLADLHAIASELSIDGYRRLRRAELIEAILSRQSGEPASGPEAGETEATDAEELTVAVADELEARDEGRPAARLRRRRSGRARAAASEESGAGARTVEEADEEEREDQSVEGVVELLPNGSGFVRVDPPEPSEDDVYVSAAQVKRCELISGDRISGPRRSPRRSERFASLVRVDAINGRPAAEVLDSTRFDDLTSAFASEPFRLESEDPTVEALQSLTPFGRGSRVVIAGGPLAGKTQALGRIAAALAADDELKLLLVLAGVRPEELSEWGGGPVDPTVAVSLTASPDAQAQAVERVVDHGRRLAARGSDAVVLIDTLGGLHPGAARRAAAAARNIVNGGSLTIIATAAAPIGGETTLIVLDPELARSGKFPAIDRTASWTLHPELLVGEDGVEAIARARSEVMGASSSAQ